MSAVDKKAMQQPLRDEDALQDEQNKTPTAEKPQAPAANPSSNGGEGGAETEPPAQQNGTSGQPDTLITAHPAADQSMDDIPLSTAFGDERKLAEPPSAPVSVAPSYADPVQLEEERQSREREMNVLLSAITDSYKSIQGKLDVVGSTTIGQFQLAQHYVQQNNRVIERLCIFVLLIPAFVMSTIAIYRLENTSYDFDLSELERKDMNILANKNFDAWNEALLSQSHQRVTELYATDVSFLPTMSDDFAVSERAEDQYFIHFVQSQPAGIIQEDKVQPMGTDAYLHAGLYDFLIPDSNNPTVKSRVKARFTFMWRKYCEETFTKTFLPGVGPDKKCHWRITHHHSSKMPSTCISCPVTGSTAPEDTPH